MPSRARTTTIIDTPEGRKLLRIHGTIARDIGIRIVSGRFQPGEVLNGEVEASDRLRVSRTAYREAVRILAAKGLVESRPKRSEDPRVGKECVIPCRSRGSPYQ